MIGRARFYTGLFVLTFATLMLEVIQTRLLSVVTWYHLAFFAISSAMFGMTAGAVWVYRRRGTFRADRLSHDLTWLTTAFAVTIAGSLCVQLTLSPVMARTATTVVVFTQLAIAMAVPFFFSGAAVSLALTKSPYPIGTVYAVDLAGAALGCLGVLAVLEWTDAPSAILLVAAAAAGAAVAFAGSGLGARPAEPGALARALSRPLLPFVALVALGLANGATRHGLQPIVVKDKVEKRTAAELAYEKWNSFSRIIARSPEYAAPGLWGASPRLPADVRVGQIDLNIDGAAGTTMIQFDGDLDRARFLGYDLTNLAYRLGRTGRGAVIGVGGGRDVLAARVFGVADITGVELNPIFVDLLRRREPFRSFAGIDALPHTRLIVDEARSWFARTPDRFDVIQMSMIDTWAATGAGAFTLTENGLYTVEGWRTFFGRLTDDGVFTVSRWRAAGDVNETGRMMSLAVAALLELGVPHPREHLFLASGGAGTPIATLVLCRSPLMAADVAALTGACRDLGFEVLVSPDGRPASPVLDGIVTAETRGELIARTSTLDLDLTPPTDDRPFFFNMLRLDRPQAVVGYVGRAGGVVQGNLAATLSLLVIFVVSLVLVTLTIVVPLRRSIREVGSGLVAGGTAFFALLGLGFMLVEMGLLQRLSVFLGHPVYALSVVLFSLILTTGIGSLVSESFPLGSRVALGAWAAATALYLGALPAWLPAAIDAFQTSGIAVRAALATAVITPAGLLMGFGFPTGMRLVQARDTRPTPWFWGINGAAGVLASVMAVAISIAFGIHVTMLIGAACYLGLVPAGAILLGGDRDFARRWPWLAHGSGHSPLSTDRSGAHRQPPPS